MALGFKLKNQAEPEAKPATQSPELATLTSQYVASVTTHRILSESWATLAARISNGVAWIKANPRDPRLQDAHRQLQKLRHDQAETQTRLDAEAVIQHDLEKQIIAAVGLEAEGRAICNECFRVYGAGVVCDCDQDAPKCAKCGLPILDSVVWHPAKPELVTLQAAQIVEITQRETGQTMCLSHYRAWKQGGEK